ncbi:MAG: CARDB domain-containing protein, partial [Candidatus ainarchaeum sp.]|nr:CARDB domain-containing protein [Candidatus ainarchaeum sp.]
MDKFAFGLVTLMVVGMAFSTPVLQVTEYSIVPENPYPDSTAQLQVTIKNSGDTSATGTNIYYTYMVDEKWGIYVGDIGAGAEAVTSVPFKVPSSVSSGVVVVKLDIYYGENGVRSGKVSTVSIPIEIRQQHGLMVETISAEDYVQEGETFDAEIRITNTGGTMRGVSIGTPDDSSFRLSGTTQQAVGDVLAGTSVDVPLSLVALSSAEPGKYSIPLEITYYDSLQNEITETAYVGPVSIADPSEQYRMTFAPVDGSEIGSQAQFTLGIENRGSEAQSVVAEIGENDVFTPIGSSKIYFDGIMPGETRVETVALGIEASSSSGYYTIPITISDGEESFTYEVGVAVEATPEITLTAETEAASSSSSTSTDAAASVMGGGGTQVTIRIANTGNTPIRSVYVSALDGNGVVVTGTKDKFIGTLNVDDFGSFQTTVRANGACTDGCVLPIVITFKDADNAEHTVSKEVVVTGEGAGAVSGGAAAGAAGAFEGRRAGSTLPFGLSIFHVAGAVVLAGAAWFGYKKWKG